MLNQAKINRDDVPNNSEASSSDATWTEAMVIEETKGVWSYEETVCLIDSINTHIDDLNHPKRKRNVFETVSSDLLCSGYRVTPSQCQIKWKSLIRSYKTAKDNKRKTGKDPSRFAYFRMIDDIFGNKLNSQCAHTLEADGDEKLPTGESYEIESLEEPVPSSSQQKGLLIFFNFINP